MVSARQVLVISLVSSTATLLGYDPGSLNGILGSQDFVARYGVSDDGGKTVYLTPSTRSLFTSMVVVGSLVGCIAASALSERRRKGSLLLASASHATGVSLQVAGLAPAVFIIGRVLAGSGLGLVSVVSPAYLNEAASPRVRGGILSMFQELLTIGYLLASALNLGTQGLSGSKSWRISLASQLLLSLCVFLSGIVSPESPAILLKWGKPDAARRSLAILRNNSPTSEPITTAIDELATKIAQDTGNKPSSSAALFLECFRGTALRGTLLAAGMGFMTLATGITFWTTYGATYLRAAGISDAYLVAFLLGIVNSAFTGPSIYLIDRIGRRTSMFVGGGIMVAVLLMAGIAHAVALGAAGSEKVLVASAVIFIGLYAATWGPCGWVTMTEPCSERLRIPQSTIALVVYWITYWAVGFLTPYIVDPTAGNLGPNVSFVWLGLTVVSLVWAYACVPEMSGLTAEQVNMLFEQKVPAWRSKAWKRELLNNSNTVVVVNQRSQGQGSNIEVSEKQQNECLGDDRIVVSEAKNSSSGRDSGTIPVGKSDMA